MRRLFSVNLSLVKAALRGRRVMRCARGARIFWSAKILNARSDPDAIRIGEDTLIKGELFVHAHGGRISLGRGCYVGDNSRIWSGSSVEIRDYVLIARRAVLEVPFERILRDIQDAAKRAHGRSRPAGPANAGSSPASDGRRESGR